VRRFVGAFVHFVVRFLYFVCVLGGKSSLPFMRLNQFPIDKDAILLRPKTGEKQFSLFLDHNLVAFLLADRKLISLRQAEREHPKILHRGLAIDEDLQMAHELVERKIDPVRFVDSDIETELHLVCDP